jgi:hypothetical protein
MTESSAAFIGSERHLLQRVKDILILSSLARFMLAFR